jgi:excisionase family DNA binding protein
MNYTVKQLATRWCCSDQHVRNLIQAHKLKAFRIGTARGYRIRHDEVERWESLTLTEASASDDLRAIGPPISIC